MRSLTTLFLVLLANLVMLVHAVVPHHHHNKLFAAVVNLLDEDGQQAFNHAHLHGDISILQVLVQARRGVEIKGSCYTVLWLRHNRLTNQYCITRSCAFRLVAG